jgi:deoxyadenosine/deoxycytidine kinase
MNHLKIGIVGPCAAGKSTLIAGLRLRGYQAKHIAQEHSYVKDMWQRLTNPDILIYLDVSYPATLERRKLNWTEAEYQVQIQRLAHAYQHADLIIDTDPLPPEQVADEVVKFIELSSTFHTPEHHS